MWRVRQKERWGERRDNITSFSSAWNEGIIILCRDALIAQKTFEYKIGIHLKVLLSEGGLA